MDPVVKFSTLTDQVLISLRGAIVSGSWTAGELHSVKEVAALLGVSRTPVREALLQLADSGLIAFERNVGFRVLRSTPAQIAEIFHLRLLLEVPAIELAARAPDEATVAALRSEISAMWETAAKEDEPGFMKHDRRFHEVAIAGAGNERLVVMVQRLRDATAMLGASTVHRSRELSDIAFEHKPILEAFEQKDPAGAASALRRHLIHTASLLLSSSHAEESASERQLATRAPQLWMSLGLAE
jgi:DNA-binding GntR family transcriptional regulator